MINFVMVMVVGMGGRLKTILGLRKVMFVDQQDPGSGLRSVSNRLVING